MAWNEKRYNRINWKNRPSTATALGATNLNHMDVFLNEVDNALIEFDANKLNIATANSMLARLNIDTETGVVTATQLDGTVYSWDLNLEKIPVSFSLSEDGVLTMVTDDGTEFTANIADMIKEYVFDDSDTIAFEKTYQQNDNGGKGAYHVTAIIKAGSITGEHLDPDYRTDIQQYSNNAQTSANDSLQYSKDSKRWAVGDEAYEGSDKDNSKWYQNLSKSYAIGTGGTIREDDDIDCAEYYYEQAKRISQGLSGALLPMGTITFSQLESSAKQAGYMYNISDSFVTSAAFKEGEGHTYPAGTNVYYTADGYWDCLAGTSVVSVNGNTGAVTITPEGIGAVKSNGGEVANTIITFEQAQERANVLPGDDLATAFGKLAKFCEDLKPAAFSGKATDISLEEISGLTAENVQAGFAELNSKMQSISFVNIGSASATNNPMATADAMLAEGNATRIRYVGVLNNAGFSQYAPASYSMYEIRQLVDSVSINVIQLSTGVIYTNTRSRGSAWYGWKACTMGNI